MSEMRTMRVIPATRQAGQMNTMKKLRVAAYCRVSTEDESQQTSYTTQKAYYTDLIRNKEGWTLAGIFADEGISGSSTKHRKQFQKMIELAKGGQIDYIITKSISRFARNTVDTLSCVRMLREMYPPVGVYFEKENIDTLDAKGELILTILSALAQEELRSLSENIKWTIQKNFQNGKAHLNPGRVFGYREGKDGAWLVNEEQAEVVRRIYRSYLAGKAARVIAEELNADGIKTIKGSVWRSDSVLYILRNEKYVGDCEMQKFVTESYLNHKTLANDGKAPRYYFTDHHTPIIDRETWNAVKLMMEMQNAHRTAKTEKRKKSPRVVAFSNLTCGDCGGKLQKFSYTFPLNGYTDERSKGFDPQTEVEAYQFSCGVWRCENILTRAERAMLTEDSGDGCRSVPLYEVALRQSFMEMLYRLKRDYEANGKRSELVMRFEDAVKRAAAFSREYRYNLEKIEAQKQDIVQLMAERDELENRKQEAIRLQSREEDEEMEWSRDISEIDPEEAGLYYADEGDEDEVDIYTSLIRDIEQRIREAKARLSDLENEEDPITLMKQNFKMFLGCLTSLPETNPAGMKLNVNTIDTQGTLMKTVDGESIPGRRGNVSSGNIPITPERIAKAPDLLEFNKRIYMSFVTGGTVMEDVIILRTVFGVELTMTHVKRTLLAFLGFRRCAEDGSVEFLTKRHMVTERKIGYSRRRKSEENGEDAAVDEEAPIETVEEPVEDDVEETVENEVEDADEE